MGIFSSCFFLFASQEQQVDMPPEKQSVEIRLVLVDVIVTKNGKFVTDLTVDDFGLYEDGEEVPIYSFELVSFSEAGNLNKIQKDKIVSPPLPQQKFVFIFDCINSWARDVLALKAEATEELLELVKLGNEIMVLQLTWDDGMEIIQSFTSEEELIRAAVEKAIGTWWETGSQLAVIDGIDPFLDETDFAADLKKYIQAQQLLDHRIVEKNKLEKTLGGILTACHMLKEFNGRKSILLVSSGIPDLSSLNPVTVIPTGRKAVSSSSRETLDAIHATGYGKEKVRIFDPFNLLRKKEFQTGDQAIEELVRFANSHNISIHSLAPVLITRSLYTGTSAEYPRREDMQYLNFNSHEAARRLQNLESLSKKTGAVSLKGADKIKSLRQLIRSDLSYYYLLSYIPQRKKADDEYHTIKVSVRKKGVTARFRRGYIDYSEENERNMLLASAFYSPELYKQLPFKADFVPFYTEIGKYKPWINIALPCQKIFLNRFVEHGPMRLNLHIWVKDKQSREKGYSSEIRIPFNVDSAFTEYIRTIDNLVLHFIGPEVSSRPYEYQVIFALIDPKTDEIGTWESSLTFPNSRNIHDGTILNCVLGTLVENTEKKDLSFLINNRDGSLEYGQIKFFPAVTNRFIRPDSAYVFMQVFLNKGYTGEQPMFSIKGEDGVWRTIRTELKAGSWDQKTKIWSGVFELDISGAVIGDNTLSVEVPSSAQGFHSVKQMKLRIH